jgi:hypothetical protein
MGTNMAPSYTNIFMGEVEERLLLLSLKQPLSWFRFIDDVDMKCIHSDKELVEFLEHANSIHPSIKFTVFRRPKSLKDTLVRAAVSRLSSTVGQCKPCGDKRFKCCLQLQHAQVFHRRQERSIRSFAMSIEKHIMWFTSLTVTSAGRNT